MNQVSEEIDNVISLIDREEATLYEVRNPVDIQPGGVEIDTELYKLSYNLKVLVKLKRMAGHEAVRLEEKYYRLTMREAETISEAMMKEMGMVRSDKFKYIKVMLHKHGAELEHMRIKYKYFDDLHGTYQEWINVYKKTRAIPDEWKG